MALNSWRTLVFIHAFTLASIFILYAYGTSCQTTQEQELVEEPWAAVKPGCQKPEYQKPVLGVLPKSDNNGEGMEALVSSSSASLHHLGTWCWEFGLATLVMAWKPLVQALLRGQCDQRASSLQDHLGICVKFWMWLQHM